MITALRDYLLSLNPKCLYIFDEADPFTNKAPAGNQWPMAVSYFPSTPVGREVKGITLSQTSPGATYFGSLFESLPVMTFTNGVVSAAYNAKCSFSTLDFTIEARFKMAAAMAAAEGMVATRYTNLTTGLSWSLSVVKSGAVYYPRFRGGPSAAIDITGTTAINPDQWYEVSVVRYNGVTTLYVNGTACGTSSAVANLDHSSATVTVGRAADATLPFVGAVAELRLTRGAARYTANHTPPAFSYQEKALNVDGVSPWSGMVGCWIPFNNLPAVDQGDFPKVVSVFGSPTVSANAGPFQENAVYFNGGAYFSIPAGAFNATPTVTIEMWVRPNPGVTSFLMGQTASGGNRDQFLRINSDGSIAYYRDFRSATNSGPYDSLLNVVSAAGVVPLGAWNHVVLIFDGTEVRVMVNGSKVASAAYTGSWHNTGSAVEIGRQIVPGYENYGGYLRGYLKDFRVTNGVRYGQSYATPARPFSPELPASTSVKTDARKDTVAFYLTGKGTLYPTDLKGSPWPIGVGTPTMTVAASRFGDGYGMNFNGTGGYKATSRTEFSIGTGDCTLEFMLWIQANQNATLMEKGGGDLSLSYVNWGVYLTSTGALKCTFGAAGRPGGTIATFTTPDAVIPLGSWKHVAIVKSGLSVKVYVDGTAVSSHTLPSHPVDAAGDPVFIGYTGQGQGSPLNFFTGRLDLVRLSQYARYTDTFTVPTEAYWYQQWAVTTESFDVAAPANSLTNRRLAPTVTYDSVKKAYTVTYASTDSACVSWDNWPQLSDGAFEVDIRQTADSGNRRHFWMWLEAGIGSVNGLRVYHLDNKWSVDRVLANGAFTNLGDAPLEIPSPTNQLTTIRVERTTDGDFRVWVNGNSVHRFSDTNFSVSRIGFGVYAGTIDVLEIRQYLATPAGSTVETVDGDPYFPNVAMLLKGNPGCQPPKVDADGVLRVGSSRGRQWVFDIPSFTYPTAGDVTMICEMNRQNPRSDPSSYYAFYFINNAANGYYGNATKGSYWNKGGSTIYNTQDAYTLYDKVGNTTHQAHFKNPNGRELMSFVATHAAWYRTYHGSQLMEVLGPQSNGFSGLACRMHIGGFPVDASINQWNCPTIDYYWFAIFDRQLTDAERRQIDTLAKGARLWPALSAWHNRVLAKSPLLYLPMGADGLPVDPTKNLGSLTSLTFNVYGTSHVVDVYARPAWGVPALATWDHNDRIPGLQFDVNEQPARADATEQGIKINGTMTWGDEWTIEGWYTRRSRLSWGDNYTPLFHFGRANSDGALRASYNGQPSGWQEFTLLCTPTNLAYATQSAWYYDNKARYFGYPEHFLLTYKRGFGFTLYCNGENRNITVGGRTGLAASTDVNYDARTTTQNYWAGDDWVSSSMKHCRPNGTYGALAVYNTYMDAEAVKAHLAGMFSVYTTPSGYKGSDMAVTPRLKYYSQHALIVNYLLGNLTHGPMEWHQLGYVAQMISSLGATAGNSGPSMKGQGSIRGTTMKEESILASCVVFAMDRETGKIAGTTFSDVNGNFALNQLTTTRSLVVYAIDPANEYNAVIFDNVMATVQP